MFGLFVQQAGEEDAGRLDREQPHRQHRGARPGQLVDRGGEQDQADHGDPHLGDAHRQFRRVEGVALQREDEDVQFADQGAGPFCRSRAAVAAIRSACPRKVSSSPPRRVRANGGQRDQPGGDHADREGEQRGLPDRESGPRAPQAADQQRDPAAEQQQPSTG